MKQKVPWIKLTNNVKSWPNNHQDVLLWLKNTDIIQACVIKNTDKLYFEDVNGDGIKLSDIYAWMPIRFILPNGLNTETYEQIEIEEE